MRKRYNRLPKSTPGRLGNLGAALALAVLAGCGGGAIGTSGTAPGPSGSGPSGAISGTSNAGSASGSGTGGSDSAGSSSGSASGSGFGSGTGNVAGGTGGTSSGGGTTGGPSCGPIAELGGCVIKADCQCNLDCRYALCLRSCSRSSDCDNGETCLPSGVCFDVPMCQVDAGAVEFAGCSAVSDCACPLACLSGGVCQHSCIYAGDCSADAGEFCEGDAGACWLTPVCNPDAGNGDYQPCTQTTDCACPDACTVDPLRGAVCERTCQTAAACAADEICEGDAGLCQRTTDCFGADAGLSEFTGCTHPADCACPMGCLVDPSFAVGVGPLLCESCSSPTDCAPPGGSCVDAGALAATAQRSPDLSLLLACSSSTQCDCPNQCLPLAGGGSFACQLPPPPCQTPADCADPSTTCISGGCIPNLCLSSAAVGQPCDVSFGQDNPALAGDGVCLPEFAGGPTLLCVQGGKASGACSVGATRADLDSLCPGGQVCIPSDGGNYCAPVCQLGSSPSCNSGNCVPINPLYPSSCPGSTCTPALYALQACLPGAATCTTDLPVFAPADAPFDSSALGTPFAPCAKNDCRCPSSCVADFFLGTLSYAAANTFCESPCATGSDCLWPQTDCSGQVCAIDRGACIAAAPGGRASTLGAACINNGSAGTCVYFSPFALQPQPGAIFTAGVVPVCRVDGTATSSCDPLATRGSSRLCGAGTDCVALADGGYGCLTLCDPLSDAGGACADGEVCTPTTHHSGGIDEGACLPQSDAGCTLGIAPQEFAPCRSQADCACGLNCVKDTALPVGAQWTTSAAFCERGCATAGDCPIAEVCLGEAGNRTCRPNLCADSSPVTDSCGADTAASGTCLAQSAVSVATLPFMPPTALEALAPLGLCGSEPALGCVPGQCLQGGAATGACDPAADRSAPELLCVAGSICDPSGPTPMCTSLCTLPDSSAGCPLGEHCLPLPGSALVTGAGNLQGECLPAMGVDAGG